MKTTSNSSPECFISSNKNRLKIYGKNVFLKDKQTFELELFNPTTQTIAAKIMINGNYISQNLIVIRPGERSYLERYIDENNKFLFETYDVENTEASKEAIKNNGVIRIEFYDEQIMNYYSYPFNVSTANINFVNTGGTFNSPAFTTTTASTDAAFTGTTGDVTYLSGTTLTGPIGFVGHPGTRGVPGISAQNNCKNQISGNTLETGRIEKGEASDQSLSNYFGTFNAYYSSVVEYQILPESAKPVEIASLRNYCGNCGTRIKKTSFNYCPSCGNKL